MINILKFLIQEIINLALEEQGHHIFPKIENPTQEQLSIALKNLKKTMYYYCAPIEHFESYYVDLKAHAKSKDLCTIELEDVLLKLKAERHKEFIELYNEMEREYKIEKKKEKKRAEQFKAYKI